MMYKSTTHTTQPAQWGPVAVSLTRSLVSVSTCARFTARTASATAARCARSHSHCATCWSATWRCTGGLSKRVRCATNCLVREQDWLFTSARTQTLARLPAPSAAAASHDSLYSTPIRDTDTPVKTAWLVTNVDRDLADA